MIVPRTPLSATRPSKSLAWAREPASAHGPSDRPGVGRARGVGLGVSAGSRGKLPVRTNSRIVKQHNLQETCPTSPRTPTTRPLSLYITSNALFRPRDHWVRICIMTTGRSVSRDPMKSIPPRHHLPCLGPRTGNVVSPRPSGTHDAIIIAWLQNCERFVCLFRPRGPPIAAILRLDMSELRDTALTRPLFPAGPHHPPVMTGHAQDAAKRP